jgi:hypothetical protein
VDQTKDRVSGFEDKVDVFKQLMKKGEKNTEEWNVQDIWDTIKRPNLQNIGMEDIKEVQAKGQKTYSIM